MWNVNRNIMILEISLLLCRQWVGGIEWSLPKYLAGTLKGRNEWSQDTKQIIRKVG